MGHHPELIMTAISILMLLMLIVGIVQNTAQPGPRGGRSDEMREEGIGRAYTSQPSMTETLRGPSACPESQGGVRTAQA